MNEKLETFDIPDTTFNPRNRAPMVMRLYHWHVLQGNITNPLPLDKLAKMTGVTEKIIRKVSRQ